MKYMHNIKQIKKDRTDWKQAKECGNRNGGPLHQWLREQTENTDPTAERRTLQCIETQTTHFQSWAAEWGLSWRIEKALKTSPQSLNIWWSEQDWEEHVNPRSHSSVWIQEDRARAQILEWHVTESMNGSKYCKCFITVRTVHLGL